ncbi:histidine phosphatase family protein [Pontibacter diazotrophicus]|uniref:Histidine phosphatase family protein n=1 Tax=Pontibacter diazotrophicus TaxID=1400979 RepID=A0A3D8LB77_9BACT|nr:phosphoglycerate mutase family protein [Pontibacter diazotrophicus]RDV14658.1 histidine phosphatase family protein [Pontibacter diazotrophicus]
MKLTTLLPLCLLLLVFSLGACRSNTTTTEAAATAPTVVYLVRHAEKATADPANEDPDLTPAGVTRAEALRALLEEEQVDALYATKYLRTINTLKPLADTRQLNIRQYEAHDFNTLKQQILQNHRGETVVIAGHSNTVLPILEAFGVERPVADIPDNTYDYLFKLTVAPSGTAFVEVSQFGNPSR